MEGVEFVSAPQVANSNISAILFAADWSVGSSPVLLVFSKTPNRSVPAMG